ncbi:MarR family transcriptional regulator [Paenibacillus albidus]|uniref:MarR family transcriptional regulator n=1 Tax=Paenibacillus albidus TaxID=2041023 RepID=A0A917D3C6_9BACL|nr:MarR family transcriptional regulator [Paenibacillus albidus]MBT2293223.1 MarR family transcriptional regulator [Paenibacillus albidus]GGG10166.1 MarR family transcriptional regulator [Paenibacillus albidus]
MLEEKEQQLDEIVSSFRRISHAFQQLLWKDAEELEITPTQLMVLRKLTVHPDIGITELAELLHLGNSAASGVVDRMVKAGLITRQRSESDRRIFHLAMTEKGKEIREKSKQSLRRHLLPLTNIPAEDAGELLRIHGEIVQILEQGRGKKKL